MLTHGAYTRTEGGPAAGVYPRFFMEAVQDPVASANEGRPIFRQEERVEIVMPGNQWSAPVKRVSDEERARWPEDYRAFRDGVEVVPDGTPLHEWPILNSAQVAELKYFKFRTVEDIAGASDSVLQRIGPGGFGLREKAKGWLDEAAGVAFTEKLSSENDQLRSEVSSLKRQIEEQGELLRQLHAEMHSIRSAPHPFDSTPAMMLDPLARVPQTQDSAGSSLSGFDTAPRRRGRPPKEQGAAA